MFRRFFILFALQAFSSFVTSIFFLCLLQSDMLSELMLNNDLDSVKKCKLSYLFFDTGAEPFWWEICRWTGKKHHVLSYTTGIATKIIKK